MTNTPEWLRLLRGWPCYVLVMYTPLWRWNWLLPYAGDWSYREDARAVRGQL